MIVRILGEGQFALGDESADRLSALDAELDRAIAAHDSAGFDRALKAALAEVRTNGRPLDPDSIVPSDLALPSEDSDLDEVRHLLEGESAES